VGREPGIGPAELTCPNTDTDHSDQSVPVLFAPLLLEGLDEDDLIEHWTLIGDELDLLTGRTGPSKLGWRCG
jgi:hypothetical protein